MGILLCEQKSWDVWRRNKSVRGEIGKILRTHKHTHAAKLVVRMNGSSNGRRSSLVNCVHYVSGDFGCMRRENKAALVNRPRIKLSRPR